MLVFCEECAKKYTIDETRIKGDKARFSCRECGHIIVVKKPDVIEGPQQGDEISDEVTSDEILHLDFPEKTPDITEPDPPGKEHTSKTTSTVHQAKGLSISVYLLFTIVTGFILISGTFAYLHVESVSKIIDQQMEMRAVTLITSLKGIIKKSLVQHEYEQVNAETLRFSKLPGVAYAAVMNNSHLVLAGFFNNLEVFDRNFAVQVRKKGFPAEILLLDQLPRGSDENSGYITVRGKAIYDKVVSIPNTGDEIHVGIYATKIDDTIRNFLFAPLPLGLLGLVLLISIVLLFLLSKTLTRPLQELTDMTNRISLGEMDCFFQPHGPREIQELGTALERMCSSVKTALQRWKR